MVIEFTGVINKNFVFAAKEMERHYLLSGDADGVIILWEYSTVDNKVF